MSVTGGNPCACGCGELVAKRLKRGHWSRLPEAGLVYSDPERNQKISAARSAVGNEHQRGQRLSAEHRANLSAAKRVTPRDGDAPQARHHVEWLVKTGALAPARTLPCTDCGEAPGLSRHEYDHFHGYGVAHHGCVQSVCCRCHRAREISRGVPIGKRRRSA